MLVIGLTGGIGSGKSTVADLFAARGVPVIDTDIIAHALLHKPEVRAEVVELFGEKILGTEGQIDRSKLGEHVFGDPRELHKLEAILHPRIREEVARQLAGLDADYTLVVVPLLVERGRYDFIDRILLVDCDEAEQRARTTARDGLSTEAVQAIMDNQASRAQRRQVADDVIDNTGTPEMLAAQVARLDAQYRDTARRA
ncbi:MAG TPA: dephospho-CoA kinase [Gammaproteobacteria bacterium]|nr:dephospho-CoA kinase [Gammaproteobacteria bacterium]